jgi:hypothetical protein
MKSICFPMILIITFLSCQTSHVVSPDSFPGQQIIVSEGGGFSGQTTQYILLDNGQVFVKTVYPESIKEMDHLDKKSLREIFNRLDLLNIKNIQFIHPGNMTYTLASRTGDDYYEIKWGDPAFKVPAEVLGYYQFIRTHIAPK